MVRFIAAVLGIILIVVAVLGFMPEFNQNGKFMGLFAITSFSNILHLATGVISLMCGLKSSKASIIFFIAVGLIYGITSLLGFYDNTMALFRFLAADGANNWFHAIIAAVALYVGIYFYRKT